jgi:outer membrane protein TolC
MDLNRMTALGWNHGGSAATALTLVLLLVVAALAAPPEQIQSAARMCRLPPVTTLVGAAPPEQIQSAARMCRLPPVTTQVGDEATSGSIISEAFTYDSEEVEAAPLPAPLVGAAEVIWPANRPGELNLPPSPAMSAASRSMRANADPHAQTWLDDYQSRIVPDQAERWWTPDKEEGLAPIKSPWWDAGVRQPISATGEPLQVGIAALTAEALQYSSYVRILSANPSIRQSELVTEEAAFDWKAFLETTYVNANDPVGNTLTTGTGADRYKNRSSSIEAGVRRRNEQGGEVEVFQRWGGERDNSRFLEPNPQRATRLELQYTQPLLKGAGRAYNQSLIVLAQIQLDRSSDKVAEELKDHLVKVTETYWKLYQTRAEFLQRRKLLASAKSILANLEGRREIDADERQVLRARTAVANRESEMLRAETKIRNSQSQLRLLVNNPALVYAGNREMMPVDSPLLGEVPLSMSDSLHTALMNRPDISQAIRDARAASVRLGVAQKDVLPKLDFVASTYVAGLANAADGGKAYGNQFSEGRPAFSVGFQYEILIGNGASRAQAKRRQWELNQAMSRFSLTVEESLTSVEVAVREVQTSYDEMVAKNRAMRAAQREADYLNDRWRVLPNANDSAAQLLENLLDAQERVADEERAVVSVQVNYALTLIKLKSEMGTLLRVGGQ